MWWFSTFFRAARLFLRAQPLRAAEEDSLEQNDNQLGRHLNNTPSVAELEAQVRPVSRFPL